MVGVWTLVIGLLGCLPALAHDRNCRGMPVSEAEKMGCCGAADYHNVDPGLLREDEKVPGLWHVLIQGQDYPIVHSNGTPVEALPSGDGCVSVWYRESALGQTIYFYCLEIPFNG